MIRLFLEGLPGQLTQPMVKEYDAKCRDLDWWAERDRRIRVRRYLRQKSTLQYLFALGIYYRYVIAPITGAASFFERLEQQQFGLKLAGRELTSEFRASVQNAADHFRQVSDTFGLGSSFFAQTDVRRIVMSLIELDERPREQN